MTSKNHNLSSEAKAFDISSAERIKNGFYPDLRNLKKVDWFYNNVWRDPEFVKIHLLPKINFIVDSALAKSGSVLEVGCGYGYLSLEMARNGLDVMALDVSSESINIAKQVADDDSLKIERGKLEYIVTDFESLDLPENSFDSIVFFRSLHHMEDLTGVLKKVSYLVKPKGLLLVSEPVRDNFNEQSALIAGILRLVLNTWESAEDKGKYVADSVSFAKYVDAIYREYVYEEEHHQSPMDNSISSDKVILDALNQDFLVEAIEYNDSFIDKLIGGLRGDDKYKQAKLLKQLDELLIENNILPHTSINLRAVKK